MSQYVLQAQPTKKSHIWAWILGGCAGFVVLLIVGFAALFLFVGSTMRGTEPYEHGLALARRDARVTAALGTPIETRPFTMGVLGENTDGTGYTQMTIPIAGPKGKAVLQIEGNRQHGRWNYSIIRVGSETIQPPIDLSQPGSSSTAPPAS